MDTVDPSCVRDPTVTLPCDVGLDPPAVAIRGSLVLGEAVGAQLGLDGLGEAEDRITHLGSVGVNERLPWHIVSVDEVDP